jgi:alpha-glucoside transport system permease protein
VAAFAAYAFAWMEFPGRQVIFATVVGLLVVPLQMALIPILRVYTNFDLNGTYPAIWLAHAGFGLPLAVYLLRNYMGSLPSSLIESAKIDGADHFKIFTRLIIPLSVPVLASFAIFQFLWVWNDLLVALVFLGYNEQVRVLTVELSDLAGRGEGTLSLLPAAAMVTMILPLVVFFSLQRFFVRGLTAGSVKG